MICEAVPSEPVSSGCENKIKKRSLEPAGKKKSNELVSPPAKKMKQARLPFAPKMSVTNCVPKVPASRETSPEMKKRRVSDENALHHGGHRQKTAVKQNKTPVKASKTVIVVDEEEQVPTSSTEAGPPAPKVPPPRSNSLDGFLQTTQQPQVSTSEADVIDLTDDSENNLDSSTSSPQSLDSSCCSEEEATSTGGQSDVKEASTTARTVSPATAQTMSPSTARTLQPSTTQTTPTTAQTLPPSTIRSIQTSKEKKFKSQKALEKEREKQRQREEKARIREEKRLKLEAEKKAKEELRKEVQRKRQLELEDAQKEKEAKKKERQARREKEEEEREEKRRLKQEARQKKQDQLDLLQAERRKKQEEKEKQESEKKKELEEAKKKNEKQQMLFKSFFKKPCPDSTPDTNDEFQACGPFAAFQLRRDMVIAPTVRTKKMHSEDVRQEFESTFKEQGDSNYLEALASGEIVTGKSGRTKGSRKSNKDDLDGDSDVEEVQSVADSSNLTLKAKLFQFHENYRPAYYGTWRKTSKKISGRNPYSKDEDLLDYEVDSDEEWEDPGESLSDSGSEDEEDKEDSGDESDDGFFVPHGYLSEDEDDAADDDRETWEKRRAAKAKDWDHEMKKKTEQLKTLVIGCVWSRASTTKEVESLKAFKAVPLMSMPILLTGVSSETSTATDKDRESKQILAVHNKIRPVPKEAMPDLIRLVHGNIAGIKNLCREFKEFWKRKHVNSSGVDADSGKVLSNDTKDGGSEPTNQIVSPLFRSAEDFEISKRQLEKKITKMAVRDKRDGFSKICWYVHPHILKDYKMEDAPVPSEWVFLTRKPFDPSKPRTAASPPSEVNAGSNKGGGLLAMFSPVSGESAAATLKSLAASTKTSTQDQGIMKPAVLWASPTVPTKSPLMAQTTPLKTPIISPKAPTTLLKAQVASPHTPKTPLMPSMQVKKPTLTPKSLMTSPKPSVTSPKTLAARAKAPAGSPKIPLVKPKIPLVQPTIPLMTPVVPPTAPTLQQSVISHGGITNTQQHGKMVLGVRSSNSDGEATTSKMEMDDDVIFIE